MCSSAVQPGEFRAGSFFSRGREVFMAALSWLLIPIMATVAAGVWGSWASRRRTGIPDTVGVTGYERFRAAMERSRVEETGGTFRPEAPAEPVVTAARRASDPSARTAD
jgi:hypothetical protein